MKFSLTVNKLSNISVLVSSKIKIGANEGSVIHGNKVYGMVIEDLGGIESALKLATHRAKGAAYWHAYANRKVS